MKLHIRYIRSLEDSERVRKACMTYLQNWYPTFYPERPDIVSELHVLAAELQGRLEASRLRRKYAWMKPLFGWRTAKWAQRTFPELKASCIRSSDRAMYRLETAGFRVSPQPSSTPRDAEAVSENVNRRFPSRILDRKDS